MTGNRESFLKSATVGILPVSGCFFFRSGDPPFSGIEQLASQQEQSPVLLFLAKQRPFLTPPLLPFSSGKFHLSLVLFRCVGLLELLHTTVFLLASWLLTAYMLSPSRDCFMIFPATLLPPATMAMVAVGGSS